jgi:hypothetical protein
MVPQGNGILQMGKTMGLNQVDLPKNACNIQIILKGR